mmetsp:Transcript_49001/g.101112  ORF Transcript_49001/g.101112 Transcript_49001/m.101112 type:complete len:99 (-) Transcript_49001:338-634(-)
MSSFEDPRSTTWPSRRQMISSALRTVDRRWAMTITLLPLLATSRSRASWTMDSLSASRALVASSNTRILGFRRMARATERRCFCPPDTWPPRSPTFVS